MFVIGLTWFGSRDNLSSYCLQCTVILNNLSLIRRPCNYIKKYIAIAIKLRKITTDFENTGKQTKTTIFFIKVFHYSCEIAE